MIIGIGTPRSQSSIPRPTGLSFQPTFPRFRLPSLTVEFGSLRGSPRAGRSPLIMDASPLPRAIVAVGSRLTNLRRKEGVVGGSFGSHPAVPLTPGGGPLFDAKPKKQGVKS
jgi:hypothetical protein